MIVAVPRETRPGETRVALTPRETGRLVSDGHGVRLEVGAGDGASFPDDAYREAGAEIAPDRTALLEEVHVVAVVNGPGPGSESAPGGGRAEAEDGLLEALPRGTVLVGFLRPRSEPETLERMAEAGVTGLALELVPRITRAQSMDALSSMSTVAGYKSALLAANTLPKLYPMLMTAAGTLSPARVLVLGAGVAGLQAIATSRRLGAEVEAFDIRPEVKEQVESLGARFLDWELEEEDVETEEGYAREVSEETKRRQQELVAERASASDVVITTALVPGRPAPLLLTRQTVERMRPGSVVVDLAAEAGGNCEVTDPGHTVEHAGVTVHGPLNLPAGMPVHASQMYARNVSALLRHLAPEGELRIDLEDPVTGPMCVTHDGTVRFEA